MYPGSSQGNAASPFGGQQAWSAVQRVLPSHWRCTAWLRAGWIQDAWRSLPSRSVLGLMWVLGRPWHMHAMPERC